MPLVKCPDCGQTVSDRAPSCPSCGCPLRSVDRRPRSALDKEIGSAKCCLVVFLGILVFSIISALVGLLSS